MSSVRRQMNQVSSSMCSMDETCVMSLGVADMHVGDLFELVWGARGCGSGAGGSSSELPAVSCPAAGSSPQFMQPSTHASSDAPPAPAADPPSEDVMASWLYEVVRGGDGDGHGGVQGMLAEELNMNRPSTKVVRTVAAGSSKEMASGSSERMMITTTTGGATRRSHHSHAHNQTEKRRRWKINQKLKTLQRLVPGCNKSDHASTLEQTIAYMKSLQHQLQAGTMPVGRPPVPPQAAPVYPMPVVQPPYTPPLVGVAHPVVQPPYAPPVAGVAHPVVQSTTYAPPVAGVAHPVVQPPYAPPVAGGVAHPVVQAPYAPPVANVAHPMVQPPYAPPFAGIAPVQPPYASPVAGVAPVPYAPPVAGVSPVVLGPHQMVSFGPVLHYPAAMMPAASAAAGAAGSLYPPAPQIRAAPAVAGSNQHRWGSSSSKGIIETGYQN